MSEFFQRLTKQIKDYWNKFNNKQRMQIIVLGVLIIISLSTAVYFATRPKMIVIYDAATMDEASAVSQVLEEKSIPFDTENSGMTIKVDKKYETVANYALAGSDLPSKYYTYEDAYNSSMTDTERTRNEKFKQAKESELEQTLEKLNGIQEASVILEIPDYDRLYQNSTKESSASIVLSTTNVFDKQQIPSVVGIILNGVDKINEENITVVDQDGLLLYGGEIDKEAAVLDQKYSHRKKEESDIAKKVQDILSTSFDNVIVSTNLVVDYNKKTSTKEVYSNPVGDGSDTGFITSEKSSSSSSKNMQSGQAPGIDSNPGETQYTLDDSQNNSESETETIQSDYIYDKDIIYEENSPGEIKFKDSSISAMVEKYVIHDEAAMKKAGLLDEQTWEEYKASISNENFTVDDQYVKAVQSGTGISDVKLVGVTKPIFIDENEPAIPFKEYLLIVVVAFLVVLLAYVIYKGTEPVEVTEIIPELSVEELLSKNLEDEVEEIQDDKGSGIKKEIERFVDEKPEAAAQLLRNWLNQDWE